MIDFTRYTVFNGKDGRVRAFDKQQKSTISFPRLIMEDYLKRKLLPTEDVHHIDGNPLNNDISNLEVIDRTVHLKKHADKIRRKFSDKQMVCPVCNNSFIWTAKQQHAKYRKEEWLDKPSAGPFCSRKCQGLYGTVVQYNKTNYNQEYTPIEKICPVCGKHFIWSVYSQKHFAEGTKELPIPCCSQKCRLVLRRINKAS